MKYSELAVTWVSNSEVELKKNTLRIDLAQEFDLKLVFRGFIPDGTSTNSEAV
jgi:hypothetical protein